jgi:hypothetical protein
MTPGQKASLGAGRVAAVLAGLAAMALLHTFAVPLVKP